MTVDQLLALPRGTVIHWTTGPYQTDVIYDWVAVKGGPKSWKVATTEGRAGKMITSLEISRFGDVKILRMPPT